MADPAICDESISSRIIIFLFELMGNCQILFIENC
jgi:hypothetical protein